MNPRTSPWLSHVASCPAGTVEDPHREDGAPEPEWLETDGRGGYACLSASSTPNRRYHGLLTAVPPGTARRHLFLAGVLDRVRAAFGETTLTRLRRRGDTALPEADGRRELELRPWPASVFRLAGGVLTREVLMPAGRQAALVRYALGPEGDEAIELDLEPLLAFRDADALTFANDVADPHAERTAGGGLRFRLYDALPAMTLTLDGIPDAEWEYEPAPVWQRGVEYQTDLARGYGGHEDLLVPGRLCVRLQPGEAVTLAATIDGEIGGGSALFDAEAARRSGELPDSPDLQQRFAAGADAFLYVGPGERRGILAGFPWFGEWGRDTFISLPGLTLARGDLDACGEVLSDALPYLRDGLLPNVFGSAPNDSHYGSADAALWFARAVLLYQRASGDPARVRDELTPALVAIAEAYRDGSGERLVALGILGDEEGLLHAGLPDKNPTWMDAQTSAGPVTPRHGYPVEINALWCSLLAHLAELTGDGAWQREAERAGRTFLARFWREEEGVLIDVWGEDAVDRAIRPNMILAASLELSPLDREMRRRLLACAEAELLTPYGLRTLAPSDPAYQPRYGGDTEVRDGAYHQGTVWPWLLGFYVEAALRVDPSDANRARLRRLWEPLGEELGRGGLGHVAEVYDGDAPHRRGGSFAQAWSTAEAMRALALLDRSLILGGDDTP